MSVVGKAPQQTIVPKLANGARTQQITAAATEQYAIGMRQAPPVRHGRQQAQVREIGDYQTTPKRQGGKIIWEGYQLI